MNVLQDQKTEKKKYGLSIGIVGLPNVGKSTLFNALTSLKVSAENYPFCTIEPNIGIVKVSDFRLFELANIVSTEHIVNAAVKFVDIAGLVKGASKGEGLGNQFLANIREVDAIAQVIRFFKDDNVIHVENKIDPKSDVEIIEMELILKDLESVDNRLKNLERIVRTAKKEDIMLIEYQALKKVKALLEKGLPARRGVYTKIESSLLNQTGLITIKPVIYVFNTNDSTHKNYQLRQTAGINNGEIAISMDVKLESELAQMSEVDRSLFKKEFEIQESGLELLVKTGYEILGLHSFFTAGEKEVRAWTIKKGDTAIYAARRIHNDFAEKFIFAEVVSFDDFVFLKGWTKAREKGKARLEGRDYIMRDGDVVLFKHGA